MAADDVSRLVYGTVVLCSKNLYPQNKFLATVSAPLLTPVASFDTVTLWAIDSVNSYFCSVQICDIFHRIHRFL